MTTRTLRSVTPTTTHNRRVSLIKKNSIVKMNNRRCLGRIKECFKVQSDELKYLPTNGPLVSVIVPCFNHGKYLDECVDSVIAQTYKDWEIIIVNDCSTDSTTANIVKFQENKSKRIKTIFNEVNLRLPATRNVAIRASSGKYILPLDADDMIHPACLAYFVDAAEKNKGDIICSSTVQFGTMCGCGGPRYYNFKQLLTENLMQCTALFHKKHWEEVGGYKDGMIYGYEDWEFWINMGKHGHTPYGISKGLFFYRKKETSMCQDAEPYREEIIRQIRAYHPELYGETIMAKSNHTSIPKVSIVIPCYNHGTFLKDCISALKLQTFQDFEIIIVDDCSTDNSRNAMKVQKTRDVRIKLLYNSKNMGPAGSRNYAIECARGKYILPLDADDIPRKDMIEKFVKVLDEGKYDLAGSWYEKFGCNKGIIRTFYNFERLVKSNCMCCCTMFHKSHWEEVGGYNGLVNGFEDWELWINLGKHGHYAYIIEEPLLKYRTAKTSGITRANQRKKELVSRIHSIHPELYKQKEEEEEQESPTDIHIDNDPISKHLIKRQSKSSRMIRNLSDEVLATTLKIRLLAICFNEEKMLPFFLRYYSTFCQEMVIYDNYSTDNSVNIINSFPNTKVVQYDTNGALDDKRYLEIKNNAWKNNKKNWDWQIVVDTDEFIWHPKLLEILAKYKREGVSIPKTNGYNMVHHEFPKDDGVSQIMDLINMGVGKPNYCKPAIFNPRKIREMNYGPGAHKIKPIGVVSYSPQPQIKFLHYKYFGIEYMRERAQLYAPRLATINFDWGQMEYKRQANADINLYNKWAEPQKAKKVL